MPIYEYVCEGCKEQFEHLLRGDEKPACPSCGKDRLSKKFSVPAAHVGGATTPPCPAQEMGACGVSDCSGGSCRMMGGM